MRAEERVFSDLAGVAFWAARRALERKWSGRGFSSALGGNKKILYNP